MVVINIGPTELALALAAIAGLTLIVLALTGGKR